VPRPGTEFDIFGFLESVHAARGYWRTFGAGAARFSFIVASGKMPSDANDHHERKDQGRNSASYATVQTNAREIAAHGGSASVVQRTTDYRGERVTDA
jgi:hypothetical protein